MSDFSNDLVSWNNPFGAQGTPTTSDGVDIRSTNLSYQLCNLSGSEETYTTELNGDSDIVRTLGLELEVFNSEVLVVLGV